MFDHEAASERDDQARRTAAARRGLRIAGAVGATGAAVAIGVTTSVAHAGTDDTTGSTTSRHQPAPADPEDESEESDDGDGQQPAPPSGQLAGPRGHGPSQGHSSGS